MQNSTTEKAGDTLNTQNNAEETRKQNSTLIDRKPIDGTPFWMISSEKGHFLVMGENIMTPAFKTEQELDEYIINHHWDLVCLLILTLIDKVRPQTIQFAQGPPREYTADKVRPEQTEWEKQTKGDDTLLDE